MAANGCDDISISVRSIDESLDRMRDHISQIQDLREELAREKSYREFVERMLGYSLSSIADYVTAEKAPRELVTGQVCALVQKLQEYRFGRFISTTRGEDREAFLRESMESLNEKHKEASLALGISNYYGIGVDADHPKSFQIFKSLYEGGYSEARSWLARCLFFGTGVESNKEEAIRLFRMDADEGKPKAQRMLGLCLHDRGDDASLAEAARYFRMAADQMDTDSQCLYAQCLKDGEGVDKNIEEAAKYFKMAADYGSSAAELCYAGCPDVGGASAQYLKMAVEHGNAVAMKVLALELVKKADCPQEYLVHYLKMAAYLGDIGSLWMYASVLLDNVDDIQNLEDGARYMKICADRGSIMGAFEYGLCLRNGKGVAQDRSEAARYFKICADTKEAPFQIVYGTCLYDGDGVARDRNEAAQYFRLAADQGSPEGQCLYGLCLFAGDGVRMDKTEAARYFKAAADEGSSLGGRLHEKCSRNTLNVNQGDVLREADINTFRGREFLHTRAIRAVMVGDGRNINMFEAGGLGKIHCHRWGRMLFSAPQDLPPGYNMAKFLYMGTHEQCQVA